MGYLYRSAEQEKQDALRVEQLRVELFAGLKAETLKLSTGETPQTPGLTCREQGKSLTFELGEEHLYLETKRYGHDRLSAQFGFRKYDGSYFVSRKAGWPFTDIVRKAYDRLRYQVEATAYQARREVFERGAKAVQTALRALRPGRHGEGTDFHGDPVATYVGEVEVAYEAYHDRAPDRLTFKVSIEHLTEEQVKRLFDYLKTAGN